MEQRTHQETIRLSVQADLDANKTSVERNKLGQFATPTVLAREVLAYGLALMPKGQDVRFLDPAIGTGSFYSALLEMIGIRPTIAVAQGYEIDPHYGMPARKLWASHGLKIELADFTRAKPPRGGFNLLICNPPYVRHHHLDSEEKLRLQAASKESAGINFSGLAGLYCHFLALSHRWMSAGGIAGWLIPSEFMDVNYGQELKRYLLEDVTLIRIHRFDPNDVQFDDALVSSAVVWFKKAKPPAGHSVEFTYGGTHAAPAISRHISSANLASETKWSPEHHERRARLYAESKGWEVVELYRLDALSGKTVKDYPETKRMLADIASGHITGLIFSKLARLARNTKELLDFAEIFREYDADLISLAESIDTSTPAGRLFYTMIAAMAQWEREEISARIAASVPIRAKMGKSLGGQAHYGYQWKDGKLVPDPTEAPIRKLMYELYREHRRKKTVAQILNERGYRTRNGSQFTDSTVTRLLRDPTAKGVRRANYTLTKGTKKAWELKPESEWVLLEVEPIISEELWNEVNAILDAQLDKRKRPARHVVHLFSGLTYCECGHKMYVPSESVKYTCNQCRNKIPIVDLEGVFHEQIKNFFFSTDEIALHLSQANATIHEKEELLGVLLKERKKLTDEVDKLYELYQGNAIDKAGFGVKYHPLAERGRQLEDEIPQVQAELDVLKIAHLSQEEIITGARDLYTRWPELPHDEKRRIVEAITDRIVIYDGEVEINLFYAPPTSAPPIGNPFTPPTPGSSTPPSNPPLKGDKKATLPVRCGCKGLKPQQHTQSPTCAKL